MRCYCIKNWVSILPITVLPLKENCLILNVVNVNSSELVGLCSISLLKLISGFQLIWIADLNSLRILDFSKNLAMSCWVFELDRRLGILTHQRMNDAKLTFAVELAEMLSADMQKEGLCGRTLTLKLKTASFEVLLVINALTFS